MSRYDFIRFGGFVNWADEDTDTFRKMKVCLPVKEPVEDDTKIGLISTDEDNPEEIAVSYSVRAAELIPWTDSFQEGYWKALIVAEANGAGTDVLLPMLKDAGLCLMECVFLMLRSDACKLFPVLCRLFPEVEEMFEIITWNDREYFVRELTLFLPPAENQNTDELPASGRFLLPLPCPFRTIRNLWQRVLPEYHGPDMQALPA